LEGRVQIGRSGVYHLQRVTPEVLVAGGSARGLYGIR
jgi:hypothetical protein